MQVFTYCVMSREIFSFSETVTSCKDMVDCFIITMDPAYSAGGVVVRLENISFMTFCEERHFLGGHYIALREWVKEAFVEPTIGFLYISVNFDELPGICTMLRFFLPGFNSLF